MHEKKITEKHWIFSSSYEDFMYTEVFIHPLAKKTR